MLSEQEANQVFDYRQKAQAILQRAAEGKDNLSLTKQKAAAEQSAFLMRQSTKSYIDELQLEGKKQRLDSAVGFKQAMIRTTFADLEDMLESDLSFKRALSASDRDFAAYMANIDLNTALSLASSQAQAQATQTKITAASSIGSAAIQGIADNQSKKA